MLFRFLSLLQACDSIHGGDDSSSLLAVVRQVRRDEVRAAEDQFEVDLASQGKNLAAISCPFMKTVAANGIFSQYPEASEEEVMNIMASWGGGKVVLEKFRSVFKSAVDHQDKSKKTLNVEAMHGNIVEHIDSTGMFDPTENRVRFYTTLACKAGGAASVPCDEAAGRQAAADTSNAKFITFETLKAANSTYLKLHAESLVAGKDTSGPMVRWWVPFAMMLDMFGQDVPNGPKGMKGIGVAKFEKLFFDGQLPHFNFQPWEVTSATSTGTPTVLLAEALIPQKTNPTTTTTTQKVNTCTWAQEMKGTYIPGCSKNCQAFSTLSDAQTACAAEPTCGGVTFSTWGSKTGFQLRQGPGTGVSPNGERTWQKVACATAEAGCKVEVFQHGDFSGWKVQFGIGSHNFAQFLAAGAKNDEVSAIKVFGAGCEATLFEHEFTGWQATFGEGIYDVSAFLAKGAHNDHVSSLKVIKRQ